MAYNYHEGAYYGDQIPSYVPVPNPTERNRVPSDRGVTPSGDITSIDFSKVTTKNAPWLERKRLSGALDNVSPNRSTTLGGANTRIDELVTGLKECAGS